MDEQRLHDAHEIFCEAFSSSIPYETFRHKHLDNPDLAERVVTLVNYQDGIPAGTNSFMGHTLLDHIAFPVVHSCDTAVREEFRGRGIASSIISEAIIESQKTGCALIYATPNQNSYQVFLKLGFHEICKMNTYVAILKPLHLLQRKLLKKSIPLPIFEAFKTTAPGGIQIELSLRCPFTEEDIVTLNTRNVVHLQRSVAFFRWKVDYLPEGEIAYLCFRRGTALCAFFVLRRYSNGTCRVCDWMVPETEKEAGQILKIVRKIMSRFSDLLTVPMVNPMGTEPVLLASGGFFRKNEWSAPFLIYPTSDNLGEETLARLSDFRNWTIRFLDGDTILNG